MAVQELEEAPSMNLGQSITQKLSDMIEGMDLPTVLQKMADITPDDEESEAARDKLMSILQKLDDMSDEERESFTRQVKDGLTTRLAAKLQDPDFFDSQGFEDALKEAVINRLLLVGAVGLVLIILLVFFGYKLYKSIKEKERKKEDKKKAKQLKKKK
ncbi:uncharacterized protein LOC131852259 [Achroia grisella]|uniref:uncharacterized protein LOC131852259 n=1 Tax=Achroia grisella TaxID=688607 RepID=UPI0027D2E0E1|nr:uncharacterized protein LOC131852259 [Achroia grisella]